MPLDFGFSDEQNSLRSYVRGIANEIRPGLREWDAKEEMPWQAIEKMGQAGLLGLIGLKNLGGRQLDYISLGVAIEELAKVDTSCAMICSMQNTLTTLTPGWDDDDIRGVYQGKKLVCIATSEEEAGSDVTNLKTNARIEGDEYVINGEKIHVSLMPGASVMGVTVQVTEGNQPPRIEFVKVPAAAPGVSCELMPEMGMRSHQLGRVRFNEVRISRDSLLGGEKGKREGKAVLYARWNVSRCLSALNALGTAIGVLDQTIEFVKKKQVYGKSIANYQSIQFPLVEHYTRVEACRLLAYKGLWMNVRGENAAREATMAKWYGVTLAVDAIKDCLQMFGAAGYLIDRDVERRFRDAVGLMFTGGTVNIMKLIVVRELLGKQFMGIERA